MKIFDRFRSIGRLIVFGVPMIVGALTTEAAATHTVTTRLDVSDPNDDKLTLREAISMAGVGDTIVFADGVRGEIDLTQGELEITHDLNIAGPASKHLVVHGDGTSRVLSV